MLQDRARSALHEVNLTEARNLSPLFDEAVRDEHPVVIGRHQREWGVLLSRAALLRLLASYHFHVHVLPEDTGAFTLWLDELNIGASGESLREARQALLDAVRAYVTDYFREFDFYRHLPDLACQEPYVLRLSLARDDSSLVDLLFAADLTPPTSASSRSTLGKPLRGFPLHAEDALFGAELGDFPDREPAQIERLYAADDLLAGAGDKQEADVVVLVFRLRATRRNEMHVEVERDKHAAGANQREIDEARFFARLAQGRLLHVDLAIGVAAEL